LTKLNNVKSMISNKVNYMKNDIIIWHDQYKKIIKFNNKQYLHFVTTLNHFGKSEYIKRLKYEIEMELIFRSTTIFCILKLNQIRLKFSPSVLYGSVLDLDKKKITKSYCFL